MREQRDEWQRRKRKAGSPLQCQRSSRMSLISPAGKVRLRLRSASLTTICHSTFPARSLLPSLLSAALGAAQFQPGFVRDGQDEGDGWRRGGRGVGMQAVRGREGGGGLLEANPWGCSVQGPFSSASVCLGKRRGSVSCIINEAG